MIQWASQQDRRELIELFNMCFPGDEGFTLWFFDRVWRAGRTLVWREQGRIEAMLQLLPVSLRQGECRLPAEYVYAVGTRPERRGQGLAGRLLRQAARDAAGRGSGCLLLVPQEPSLFAYYAQFGYRASFSLEEKEVFPQPLPAGMCLRPARAGDSPALAELYRAAMEDRPFVERDEAHFRLQVELYGENALVLEEDGIITACGFIERAGAALRVAEALGSQANRLAAAVLNQRGEPRGVWRGPGEGKPFAMAKPLTAAAKELLAGRGAYCNLLYN